MSFGRFIFASVMLAVTSNSVQGAVIPFPREILAAKRLVRFDLLQFARKSPIWHDCRLSFGEDGLVIRSTGTDPFFELPEISAQLPKQLVVRFRGRFRTGGAGRIYWRTTGSPQWSEQQAKGFALVHDGRWREYQVPLEIDGALLQLRFDPGATAGTATVSSIEIGELRLHPLEIEEIETDSKQIKARVRNHGPSTVHIKFGEKLWDLPGNDMRQLVVDVSGDSPFETRVVAVESSGFPPIRRGVCVVRPHAKSAWVRLRSPALEVRFAEDGSGAHVVSGGKVAGYIAPLLHIDGVTPRLKLHDASDQKLEFRGEGVAVRAELRERDLTFEIESDRECEGPVVRPLGELQQGLLAGVEYLGKGEQSSSTLDIETFEHLRFAPDRFHLTMPLAVCRTPAATFSLTWDNMHLEPRFASPNFLDGAPGHRMSLNGRKISATLRIVEESLEDAILWAVRRRGIPKSPDSVRTAAEQRAMCLAALEGPLRGPSGWGHCAEPNWERAPYADMASTVFQLTGKAPELPALTPGGSHLRNDAAFFLTRRTKQWREIRAAEAESVRTQQQPDGSFRYSGPFSRGHFDNTASGYEAEFALKMLDWAAYSGDARMLDSGIKSLERMRKFHTPRGAQTWEMPLHTPDILASAWLVRAYLRGFELTGRREFIHDATRWAITGVPFIYQWSEHPIMLYATVGVLGATQWKAPNWIGLPVQWCGVVYADAIARLAEYDQTLDWRRLAEGILHTAERMQWTDGQFVGCLPDAFELRGQQRLEAAINPCALISLRQRLDRAPTDLYVAAENDRRIVAPFPVSIQGNSARISAIVGVSYDVLIDGERIETIESRGLDSIDLNR